MLRSVNDGCYSSGLLKFALAALQLRRLGSDPIDGPFGKRPIPLSRCPLHCPPISHTLTGGIVEGTSTLKTSSQFCVQVSIGLRCKVGAKTAPVEKCRLKGSEVQISDSNLDCGLNPCQIFPCRGSPLTIEPPFTVHCRLITQATNHAPYIY
jgi:hypothetical protein